MVRAGGCHQIRGACAAEGSVAHWKWRTSPGRPCPTASVKHSRTFGRQAQPARVPGGGLAGGGATAGYHQAVCASFMPLVGNETDASLPSTQISGRDISIENRDVTGETFRTTSYGWHVVGRTWDRWMITGPKYLEGFWGQIYPNMVLSRHGVHPQSAGFCIVFLPKMSMHMFTSHRAGNSWDNGLGPFKTRDANQHYITRNKQCYW